MNFGFYQTVEIEKVLMEFKLVSPKHENPQNYIQDLKVLKTSQNKIPNKHNIKENTRAKRNPQLYHKWNPSRIHSWILLRKAFDAMLSIHIMIIMWKESKKKIKYIIMSKTDEKIYLNGVRKRISWIIDSLIPTDDHQNIHTYILARVFVFLHF